MSQAVVVKVIAPGGKEYVVIGYAAEAILHTLVHGDMINGARAGCLTFDFGPTTGLRMTFRQSFEKVNWG